VQKENEDHLPHLMLSVCPTYNSAVWFGGGDDDDDDGMERRVEVKGYKNSNETTLF
jgi:hypothetical protein